MKLRVSLDLVLDRDGEGGLILAGTGKADAPDAPALAGFNQRKPVSLSVLQRIVGELILTAHEQAPTDAAK